MWTVCLWNRSPGVTIKSSFWLVSRALLGLFPHVLLLLCLKWKLLATGGYLKWVKLKVGSRGGTSPVSQCWTATQLAVVLWAVLQEGAAAGPSYRLGLLRTVSWYCRFRLLADVTAVVRDSISEHLPDVMSTASAAQLANVSLFFIQCMDRSIALTQARYLEKEEKCLPPPRLVDVKMWPDLFFLLPELCIKCVLFWKCLKDCHRMRKNAYYTQV